MQRYKVLLCTFLLSVSIVRLLLLHSKEIFLLLKPPELLSYVNISYLNEARIQQDNPLLIEYIRTYRIISPAENKPRSVWKVLSTDIKGNPLSHYVLNLLKNKTNGLFIECGAYSGLFLSNTVTLEMNWNWTGLLVEADPVYHNRLRAIKRNVWLSTDCMSPKAYPTTAEMQRNNKVTGWSNIQKYYFENLQVQLKPELNDWTKFSVQCFPLYSLVMASLSSNVIDYLSLDTEGSEWNILQTIPFDKIHFNVISFELNTKFGSRQWEEMKKFLQSYGFIYKQYIVKGNIRDVVFVHEKIL